jgi:uncharacterized membrane protein
LPQVGTLTIIVGLVFQLAMIQVVQDVARRDAASVLLLPRRSLSRIGLIGYLTAQSIATLGFALIAAWRGIVLAPVFAVLELVVVAWCVLRVWRRGDRGQVVTITPDRVEIASTTGTPAAQFHPYWMRVRVEPGRWQGWPTRLLVGSHGREVEIGAFLNDAERRELARELMRLLREVQTRDGDSELGTR